MSNPLLFLAVHLGSTSIVKLLLEAGANPNIFSQEARTLLQEAARLGHMSVVKLLLQEGADPTLTFRFVEATPRWWATQAEHGETASLLLEAEAVWKAKKEVEGGTVIESNRSTEKEARECYEIDGAQRATQALQPQKARKRHIAMCLRL